MNILIQRPRSFASKALLWTLTAKCTCLTLILFLCAGSLQLLQAQQTVGGYHIQIITTNPPIKSMRGLSVVDDNVVWVSGTGGMVGRSINGGDSWEWHQVKGCDSCDWRSLYAFNDRKALVLNAGEPAHLFLTEDGGQSWQQVYFNATPGIFFDAMTFYNEKEGIAIGDPLQQHFTLLRTHDGGKTWQLDAPSISPGAITGEAIFAASGTSLIATGNNLCFATGGTVARLHKAGKKWESLPIPIIQGQASTGVFSIAFLSARKGIAVGGDYKNDTLRANNCLLTSDGGRTWTAPRTAPGGYKSCVAYITPQLLITTGTSGTDISVNGGMDWKKIGEGFNCAAKARNGKRVFLTGKTIGRLENTPSRQK